jgi:hypothetical protein
MTTEAAERPTTKRKRGFDKAIARRIINMIARGIPAHQAAKRAGISWGTWHTWNERLPSVQSASTRARTACIDRYFSEMHEVSRSALTLTDAAAVNAARLHVDTLKWSLSKLRPEQYGDRIDVNQRVSGSIDITNSDQAQRQLAATLAKYGLDALLPPAWRPAPALPPAEIVADVDAVVQTPSDA